DTVSILVMEIVDNGFLVAWPGAMTATLADALFWVTLVASLAVAFVATVPVNRWMIGRGRGHAVVHEMHGHAHH
ncbi:MAG: rane protein, partial [Nocardioides sp.]|nr:rane protein [Nocardioides sp.]